MLFRYSYAAKVCAKNKSLCYRYVIFRLRSFQQELWLYILNVVNFAIKLLNEKIYHSCPEKFYHSVSCLGPSPSGTLVVRSV